MSSSSSSSTLNNKGSDRIVPTENNNATVIHSGRKPGNYKRKNEFFNISPEEIWIMILDQVDDANKPGWLNSSIPELRRLLLPIRQQFLFLPVFEILRDKYDICLKKEDIHLRHVCKSWRIGADILYPANNFFLHLNQQPNDDPPRSCFNFEFSDASKIRRFLNIFKNPKFEYETRAGPFIGGQVNFTAVQPQQEDIPEQVDNSQEFYDAIRDLVEQFGTFVLFCTINITDQNMLRPNFLDNFREWLFLMPNLVALDWRYNGESWLPQDVRPFIAKWKYPFPKFRKLSIVKFVKKPDLVASEILKRNRRIRNVTSVPKMFTLRKVKMLDMFSWTCGVETYRDLVRMECFAQTWKNLKIACLDFKETSCLSWILLYKILARYSTTLEGITIWLPAIGAEERHAMAEDARAIQGRLIRENNRLIYMSIRFRRQNP